MRAALYARYSSDLQNASSADDQLAALTRHAAANGWAVIASYKDEAISGATLATRPGMLQLLADAAERRFDLVLAEDLDRLARDQEASAHIRKRLAFHGIALETLAMGRLDGMAGAIQAGVASVMGELFLEQLRHKTRRGLEARVRAGFSGGGRCYGYRPGAAKGELAIEPAERDIVVEIFQRYDRGESPRVIAHDLNRRAVPAPRGRTWTASAINGDRRAQDGILHQALYAGERVFGRRTFRKHPDTGRRSGVLNPPHAWLRIPAPELRLVEPDLWDRVQARKRDLSATPGPMSRRPKRLLSGLLRCARCGGAMVLQGARYACSAARERGPAVCTNRKVISADALERRVLEGVRTRLLSPAAIAEAVRAFHEEAEADRRRVTAERGPIERELAEIGRRLDRVQSAYVEGAMEVDELKARSAPLKARREALEADLAAAGEPTALRLHPGAAEFYRGLVDQLAEVLADADAGEVRLAMRRLIERVDFTPLDGHGRYDLVVHGKIAALLGIAERAAGTSHCEVKLGAGTRSGRNLTIAFAA